MLEVRDIQASVREKVLNNYTAQGDSTGSKPRPIEDFRAISEGDMLFSRQLVDREFYKRARNFSAQNSKEGKAFERFEQQMRSGQETRKRARHREFM